MVRFNALRLVGVSATAITSAAALVSSCAVYGISLDVQTFQDSGADVPASCTGDIYFQVDVDACSCGGSTSYAVCDGFGYACACYIPSGYSPACPPDYTAACSAEDGATDTSSESEAPFDASDETSSDTGAGDAEPAEAAGETAADSSTGDARDDGGG